MLVTPFPCGFVQAEILCERATVSRVRLTAGDLAVIERRVCRVCIQALRAPAVMPTI
jgi:hypothetical protein